MLISNQLIGFGAQVAVPQAHVLFADNDGLTGLGGSSSARTFSSKNFGTAYSDRYMLVGVFTSSTSLVDFSSITIGGVSASKLGFEANGSNTKAAFWIAAVPTGTSGSLVFTPAAGIFRMGWVLWNLRGLASTTPSNTATDTSLPHSQSLSVPAGGIGVAFQTAQNQSAAAWSGLTESADSANAEGGTNYGYSGACDDFASAATPTVAVTSTGGSGALNAFIAASFSPA